MEQREERRAEGQNRGPRTQSRGLRTPRCVRSPLRESSGGQYVGFRVRSRVQIQGLNPEPFLTSPTILTQNNAIIMVVFIVKIDFITSTNQGTLLPLRVFAVDPSSQLPESVWCHGLPGRAAAVGNEI